MSHRLLAECIIENFPELRGTRRLLCRVAEARVGQEIRPAYRCDKRWKLVGCHGQQEPGSFGRLVGIHRGVGRALAVVQRVERAACESSGNVDAGRPHAFREE